MEFSFTQQKKLSYTKLLTKDSKFIYCFVLMSDNQFTCYEGKVQYCQPRQGFIRCNVKIEGKRDIIFFTEEIPEAIRTQVRTGIRVCFHVVKSNPRRNCVGKTINHWAKIIGICEDDANSSHYQKSTSSVSLSRNSPEFIPRVLMNGQNLSINSSDENSNSELSEWCYSDRLPFSMQFQQPVIMPSSSIESLRNLSHNIMQRVAKSIYFELNQPKVGMDFSQKMKSSCWDMLVQS